MARRASSSSNPIWIIIVIVVFLAFLGGGFYFYNTVSDPYRTLTPLDTQSYLANSNSLRGNTYKLSATIDNSLSWSPSVGRLFSVDVDGGNGNDVLPLLIPPEFNQINIQKGQKFYFEIEVGDKGLLRVKGIKKV
ncbi:MAG: hypothetical protein WCD79_16785 [Chthoniobacteraceae bacterium]